MKEFMDKKDLQPVRAARGLTRKLTINNNLLTKTIDTWMRAGSSKQEINKG